MIRILHTACAGLLVMVALLAYGLKEETAQLRREVDRLKAERAELADAIDLQRAEWAALNAPDTLRRIADHLYGEGRMLGADGEILTAWRPEQLVEIRDLPLRPGASGGGAER